MSHSERIQEAAKEIFETVYSTFAKEAGLAEINKSLTEGFAAIISKHIPEQNEHPPKLIGVEDTDCCVLEFDCGCEMRIFPRDFEGGITWGFGTCKHQTHQANLPEILQFSDGILLTKFHIIRKRERSLSTPSEPLGVTKEKK